MNTLRGYELGREARARGAQVVYGGIHATLFPDEPLAQGGAHAVVTGDGDRVWDDVSRPPLVWQRAKCVKSLKSRLAFVRISKLYRQMYAKTGISTDRARSDRARRMTRLVSLILTW